MFSLYIYILLNYFSVEFIYFLDKHHWSWSMDRLILHMEFVLWYHQCCCIIFIINWIITLHFSCILLCLPCRQSNIHVKRAENILLTYLKIFTPILDCPKCSTISSGTTSKCPDYPSKTLQNSSLSSEIQSTHYSSFPLFRMHIVWNNLSWWKLRQY